MVHVNCDIFNLVGDIPELDSWCNTCCSCILYCRKCKVYLNLFVITL